MRRWISLGLLTIVLVLAVGVAGAMADVLERPEVPAENGLITHPKIDGDNNIYRLLPRWYLMPGDTATAEEYAQLIDQFNVEYGLGVVKERGWYEPGGRYRRYTYCNYFSADVAQAMGAFLPGGLGNCLECGRPRADEFVAFYCDGTGEASIRVDGMDNPIYADLYARGLICEQTDAACKDAELVYIHLSSNETESLPIWLDTYGAEYGWSAVVPQEGETAEAAAQRLADEGRLTIGARADNLQNHVFVVHPNTEGRTDAELYMSEAGAKLQSYVPAEREGYLYYTYASQR